MDYVVKRPWIAWLIIGTLAAILIGGCAILVCAVRTSIEAEEGLHAVMLAIGVVDQYIVTQRRWPRSWTEIEQAGIVVTDASHFRWPEDAAEVKRRVEIDFDVAPGQLCDDGFAIFEPIRPTGPCYTYHGMLQTLYDHVCELQHETDATAPTDR